METTEERVKRLLIEWDRADRALRDALDAWEVTRDVDIEEYFVPLGQAVRDIFEDLERGRAKP